MTALPVASSGEVRRHARRVALRYPRELAGVLALHALAAASGLVVPRLIGALVDDLQNGGEANVDRIALLAGAFVLVQAVLMRFAIRGSARLGEKVLAEMREEFVRDVAALPLRVVERAGSGDLVARASRDVDALSRIVQHAIPDSLVALTTIVITVGALVLVGPLLALPSLVAVPILWSATRWYLRRARDGYLSEAAAYSELAQGITETVEGARTVEALRLGPSRLERVNEDIARAYAAERYTLRLRTVFLPICDSAYVLPIVATLLVGGLLYSESLVTLGAVTTAVLYTQQLVGPADMLLFWMNELQVGSAAVARLVGVGTDREAVETPQRHARRQGDDLVVRGASYAYVEGRDVLHGVDLEIRRGERVAIVGPSGAGKSTLGCLLAGIHEPRSGAVTVGGVPLTDLPLEERRGEVALVTQEQHVFHGTLRENLAMAKPDAGDDELRRALGIVDAWEEWGAALGLDAEVGSGGEALTPSQVQQIALARLVLADPRILVLDEATSLLSPRAARHLERSLAAVLDGRTVIAIAHRLHTAHDADRVVVMDKGRIQEIGSHDELVRRGGAYASLWSSWNGASA